MLVALLTGGCVDRSGEIEAVTTARAPRSELAISRFCSDCHPLPNPASFARERWHHEVTQGINFYRKSQRTDLVIPDIDAATAWFSQYAPEQLAFEKLEPPTKPMLAPLQREEIPLQLPNDSDRVVAISHTVMLSEPGEPAEMVLTDMREGHIWHAMDRDGRMHLSSIGRVANAAHVEPVDLDEDGVRDFLVADLGGFFPRRTRTGSLWWFHPSSNQTPKESAEGEQTEWERVPLRMGMMRVSDVRPADFDGDGDTDLVLAEFGLHFHGGIHLLTNVGIQGGVPQFRSRQIDDRPGAIHVPIIDLNGDGYPDFVALISQHHEAVVAFINRGDGTFRKETIYEAGDPAFGSSGIDLLDFDDDGDIDVLMSNGDTFDDQMPKPLHSVAWLENEGGFPFRRHRIGQLPGAYRAVAGDLDGDGDQDVAAVSLLFDSSIQQHPPATFDGVVYFEQKDDASFVRHRLQVDHCNAATCRLVDWDGDQDLDLLVLPFSTSDQAASSLTLFRNTR